jgi:hypothetical protein
LSIESIFEIFEEKIEGSLRKKLKEEEKIEGSLRKKLKEEN